MEEILSSWLNRAGMLVNRGAANAVPLGNIGDIHFWIAQQCADLANLLGIKGRLTTA